MIHVTSTEPVYSKNQNFTLTLTFSEAIGAENVTSLTIDPEPDNYVVCIIHIRHQ